MNSRKTQVEKSSSFDLLDVRLGKVIQVESAHGLRRPAYFLRVDFGPLGVRSSVGRFTCQSKEQILDAQVIAVLNFPPRKIGPYVSEILILGTQILGADEGEATFLMPFRTGGLGSAVF